VPYLGKMLARIAPILFIALIASCLSMPESPDPEPELDVTAQAATVNTAVPAETDADLAFELDLEIEAGDPDGVTTGGHCNVRLTQCDPYPIGKGKHPGADAQCSLVCLDTIAHCRDYSVAEIEFCCTHPDQDYRDYTGRLHGHCMPSGEPNWATRCEPGLNP
jgi:hypothetical protein